MALESLLWQIPLVILLVVAGLLTHEICHYIPAYVFGGEPKFGRWSYGLPTQVQFESPGALTENQIRFVGGIVLVFPVIVGLILLVASLRTLPDWIFILSFFMGASPVSSFDMLAVQYPRQWQKLAQGDAIYLRDFEE